MSDERQGIHRKQEPSRALVPVENACQSTVNVGGRPLATFITQMLACRSQLPDFRQRRQAKPLAATAAYTAASTGLLPQRFKRSL